jgi:hypothetical protein
VISSAETVNLGDEASCIEADNHRITVRRSALGPLQFMVIGFEGNNFKGEIIPELNALRERDLVRLIDLVFIRKDGNGSITSFEMADLKDGLEDPQLQFDDDAAGNWFALEDIEYIGEELPDQSSVALVLLEHSWARPLHEATRRANGELLAQGMLPDKLVAEVEALVRT